MKKYLLLIAALILALSNIAWFGPQTSSNQVASSDTVAASSDTHSVGSSAVYYKKGFIAYNYMPERILPPTAITSFGGVWVSTDGELYYTDDAGTTEQIST